MNRNIIYLLAAGSFLTGTVALVISGIIDVIASDMHISVAMAGQMMTIYSFSSAIGAPIIVMYTAKWERKKVLLSVLILFVIGNALTAASSYLLLLLLARIILGISGGAYIIVAISMASKLAVPEKKGNVISIIMTGYSSSLVLGVPLGVLMTNWMNWRWIFLLLALVTLLTIAGIARLVPKIEGHASASFKKSLSLFTTVQ
ncbi:MULTISPECIES: MFS transporter [Bacillus]|uniref:Major facilitator superfamily (MFS) profile domain-containing protein n=2 Tax=Bacillus TaxID=1386 RepID=A0A0M4G6B6_9BACI|nr:MULTISPECIES: MFS transporter [Bacillus]ALC80378.1 hypothetical protein AM592_01250 [Bacillus gobiensis]MBP1083774.1 DHA1 family putative efflux transporter-like MFS transporter [Bacillus capparidis]MED1098259.1 MFS transporter [Bacillus capparidis]